jgi:hypothetical protein
VEIVMVVAQISGKNTDVCCPSTKDHSGHSVVAGGDQCKAGNHPSVARQNKNNTDSMMNEA